MNREETLRRALPEPMREQAASLASGMSRAEVEQWARALQLARREGRAQEQGRRRQARTDARKHNHYREEIPGRNLRLIAKQAEGAAGGDLFWLEGLADIRRSTDRLITFAVAGCRARGLSDAEIAEALDITRQAVGQRFGRKGTFTRRELA